MSTYRSSLRSIHVSKLKPYPQFLLLMQSSHAWSQYSYWASAEKISVSVPVQFLESQENINNVYVCMLHVIREIEN